MRTTNQKVNMGNNSTHTTTNEVNPIGFRTSQNQFNSVAVQEHPIDYSNIVYNEEQLCVLKFVNDYFNQKQLGYKLPFDINEKRLIDNLDKVFIKYRENLI